MKKINRKQSKQTFQEIQDCLNSDDELPMAYTEEPELPAYLDDERFDEVDLIQFSWLNKSQPILSQTQEDNDAALIAKTPKTHEIEITSNLRLPTNEDVSSEKVIFEEWNSSLSCDQNVSYDADDDETELKLTFMGDRYIDEKGLSNDSDSNTESAQPDQTRERRITHSTFAQTSGTRVLLKKGILKEQDILCVKSFAAHITDDCSLLWFIDFLANKDLQSEYNLPKSCLVPNPNSHDQIFLQTVPHTSSTNTKFEVIMI